MRQGEEEDLNRIITVYCTFFSFFKIGTAAPNWLAVCTYVTCEWRYPFLGKNTDQGQVCTHHSVYVSGSASHTRMCCLVSWSCALPVFLLCATDKMN